MTARPVPGAGKFRAGPWADSDPAPALAEPCPQCAAPAARTPQGTLTDCPACGLVLTTACRERIAKAEDTTGRTTASTEPAVPDLAGQWQLAAVELARQRKRSQVVSLYRAWARAIDPARLDGQLAAECAGLCDGLNAAADLAATVPDLAALARFHAEIGRGLVQDARDLHAEVQEAREQDSEDEDDYEDEDSEDDYETGQDTGHPRHADTTPRPALLPAGPRCTACGHAAAVAQVDTEPGHRYATGMAMPADLCMPCLTTLRATVSTYTYLTVRVTRAYAAAGQLPAARTPAPAGRPVLVTGTAALGASPRSHPGGPFAPGNLRPSPVTRTVQTAGYFQRRETPRVACEIRAAHPVRVILGNAMPAARVRVTMTSRAGRTSVTACSPECAQQAAAILNKNGTGKISVEAI